jgi:pimeloyl-ACP methyl ester carboxylesterase
MSRSTRTGGWTKVALATFQQASDRVFIREPGKRAYRPPADVSESAKALWEYAVLSENAYYGAWKRQRPAPPEQEAQVLELPEATPEAYASRCVPGRVGPIPLPGWTMWENFPSRGLLGEARRVGLYVEVWEKRTSPAVIAIVFRGTEFNSVKDWISNLRWFLWFVPWLEDQYTVVSRRVGREFVDRLAERRPEIPRDGAKAFRVVAAGHSLGGGLAQHVAYSMPLTSSAGAPVPRVSRVYAFDPSPVTGWSSVARELRRANAAGLRVDRVFEHGEILAYVRLLLGYVTPPSAANPSVREIRYNFVQSANPFSSHSMRLLACALIDASGQARLPDVIERFRGKR